MFTVHTNTTRLYIFCPSENKEGLGALGSWIMITRQESFINSYMWSRVTFCLDIKSFQELQNPAEDVLKKMKDLQVLINKNKWEGGEKPK